MGSTMSGCSRVLCWHPKLTHSKHAPGYFLILPLWIASAALDAPGTLRAWMIKTFPSRLVATCPLGEACRSELYTVSYAGLIGAAMITSWLEAEEYDEEAAPSDEAVVNVLAAESSAANGDGSTPTVRV